MAKDKKTSKLNLSPTAGYLIIQPMEAAKQTASGLYLPDNATGDKPQKGTILAVGPEEITDSGVKRISPVKIGDVVIYKKSWGGEVKIEGKEYLFTKFDEILAIENK